ncbi:MAG: hypothetical protein AAGG69_06090 [Pseudomonadota bacterium]
MRNIKPDSPVLLARIEQIDVRKDKEGEAYSVVTYRIAQQVGGAKIRSQKIPGARHTVYKKGQPPKGADIDSLVVVQLGALDLDDIAYPGAENPPWEQDRGMYTGLPILIIILISGDTPPRPKPDPEPDDGGEGTDPDKDTDKDEEPDQDTDAFMVWR